MKFSQGETLINARNSTVWDVLTDTSNVTVWDSGITAIRGDMRDGGTIRIRTNDKDRGGHRMRVQQLPGHVMTWRAGLPLGLLRRTFTVVLTPQSELTHLRISHELSGPLSPFAGKALPATDGHLQEFVEAVRKRSELLDRHI